MRRWVGFAAVVLLALPLAAYAHGGGTDGNGGHYDRSTGEYHYHHGYPAHQHTDGVCPYDFDDKTGENSGSSGSGSSGATQAPVQTEAAAGAKGTVTGSSVNVRSGASTSYGVIGSAQKGDTVQILSVHGNWYKIRKGNLTGYISGKYIQIVPTPASTKGPQTTAKIEKTIVPQATQRVYAAQATSSEGKQPSRLWWALLPAAAGCIILIRKRRKKRREQLEQGDLNRIYMECGSYSVHPDDSVVAASQRPAPAVRSFLDTLPDVPVSPEPQRAAPGAGAMIKPETGLEVVTVYANMESRKFHRPTCEYVPSARKRVIFGTRDQAIAQGYVPCKVCKP